MLWILLGSIYHANGAIFTIIQKKIGALIPGRWALSAHLLFVPFGVIGIVCSYLYNSNPVSSDGWVYAWLVGWFGLSVAFNMYVGLHILRWINTSSFFKYTTGMTLILAILSDFLFFNSTPTYITFSAGILFLITGNLLNADTQKDVKIALFIKLFILALGNIVATTIFKQIALMSTNDFLSIFVTQTTTQLIVWMFGITAAKSAFSNPRFMSLAWIYGLLTLSLVLLEFYTFQILSVFLIVALSNIKFFIFLAYDWLRKDIHLDQRTVTGTLIGLFAIGLLIMDM